MMSLYHLAVLINTSKRTLQAAATQTRTREQVINRLYCLSLNSRIWFKTFFLFYKARGQNTLCPEDLVLLEDGRQHIVLISVTVTLDGISLTCVANNNQRFGYSSTEKTYFTCIDVTMPYGTQNGGVSECQETVTTVYILVRVKVYAVRRLHGSLSRAQKHWLRFLKLHCKLLF